MANIVSTFFDKVIEKRVNKAVQDIEKAKKSDVEFSGILPINTDNKKPLDKPSSKGVTFDVLRALSIHYPVARACINYRKTQITQLSWDIAVREDKVVKDSLGVPIISKEQETKIQELKEFFRYPTGGKERTIRHWMSEMMEDTLVLDACALYKKKNRGGSVYGFLPVDGATIKLRVDKDGTLPLPPEVAYHQVIRGKTTAELTSDEMIYRIMHPRTTTPYGLSPIETLILTISTALKLQSYNLAFLTEGTVPEGFMELPPEIAKSQKQLAQFQQIWDAMLAGDHRATSKLRFIPAGSKYTPTKKQSDMAFERFETWLMLNTCTVFSVAPQDIGFTHEINKATSETQWEIGRERGLMPLAHFLKEIFDEIIQKDFEESNLEWIWTNVNPTNRKDEAEVTKMMVEAGAVSVDEWRVGEGKDPIGLSHYIKGGNIQLVRNIIKEEDTIVEGEPAKKPKKETKEEVVEPKPKEIKETTKMTNEDILNQVPGLNNSPMVVSELKKWKKVSLNDLDRGRPFREFQTGLIDERVKSFVKSGLQNVKTNKDIIELFEPFLSPETRIINAVLDLYENLGKALNPTNKKD